MLSSKAKTKDIDAFAKQASDKIAEVMNGTAPLEPLGRLLDQWASLQANLQAEAIPSSAIGAVCAAYSLLGYHSAALALFDLHFGSGAPSGRVPLPRWSLS